jgi:hypothetical protein
MTTTKVSVKVERKSLLDTFINAIEMGGSGEWFALRDKDFYFVFDNKTDDESWAESLFRMVYDEGYNFTVVYNEDETEVLGVLSKETFNERLQIMAEAHPQTFVDEFSGDGDAFSADMTIQYLVMAEYVFA